MKQIFGTMAALVAAAAMGAVFGIFPLPASADNVAQYAVNGGGTIVLQDDKCEGKLRFKFFASHEGQRTTGCWTLSTNNGVVLFWDDGDITVYPMAAFKKPTRI